MYSKISEGRVGGEKNAFFVKILAAQKSWTNNTGSLRFRLCTFEAKKFLNFLNAPLFRKVLLHTTDCAASFVFKILSSKMQNCFCANLLFPRIERLPGSERRSRMLPVNYNRSEMNDKYNQVRLE